MDLTINYDHTKQGNAEMLGATKERWEEIRELTLQTKKDPLNEQLKYNSQAIEWVLSQLKDVTPADLVIVGYMFG